MSDLYESGRAGYQGSYHRLDKNQGGPVRGEFK
jgi:hypothetical protein